MRVCGSDSMAERTVDVSSSWSADDDIWVRGKTVEGWARQVVTTRPVGMRMLVCIGERPAAKSEYPVDDMTPEFKLNRSRRWSGMRQSANAGGRQVSVHQNAFPVLIRFGTEK